MKKSTPKASPELKRLWRRREELLILLLSDEPTVVGSVYDVLRRCGNPSCHCSKRPTHRQTLLVFVRRGRRLCRFVRKAQAPAMKQAAHRYKVCRQALRDLAALQKRERGVLSVQIRQRAIRLK